MWWVVVINIVKLRLVVVLVSMFGVLLVRMLVVLSVLIFRLL